MAFTQIYSYQMTSNHALSISLMHDPENKWNPYFIFLNLAPGGEGENGRTFDYKNTIALKLNVSKIAELSHALTCYAKGQQKIIGPFSIFVDSSRSQFGGDEKKSVMLNYSAGGTDSNGRERSPSLSLNFKMGTAKSHAFMMSPTAALALADVCGKIFEKGIELDLSREQNVSISKPSGDSDYKKRGTPVPPKAASATPTVEIDDSVNDPF